MIVELGRLVQEQNRDKGRFRQLDHYLVKAESEIETMPKEYKPTHEDFPDSEKKFNYFSLIKAGLVHERNEIQRLFGQCFLGKVLLCVFDRMCVSAFSVLNMAREAFALRHKELTASPTINLYCTPKDTQLRA